jgi:RNA polymerase sigma-70 factor (ECF subfamily)
LSRLLALLRPRLVRAIGSWLRSPADVEDCLQETLLALTRALHSFRGDSSVVYFAVRIANRHARAHQRRVNSDTRRVIEHARLERPNTIPPSVPSEVSLRARQNAALCQLLRDLPRDQAQTIVLRAVFEYSVQEIAAVCGVPANTVRSRMRLARSAIRRRIDRDAILTELFDIVGYDPGSLLSGRTKSSSWV